MASTILQLSNLISNSASTLVKTCEENKLTVPDLHDTFTMESEAFRFNPIASDAANVIVAAALQLAAAVASPHATTLNLSAGQVTAAALRVCLECNVTEILREAGPQGLHVDRIADKCNIDPKKLGRLLRALANHQVYREIRPNVFTNTRVSGALDTGKSVDQLHDDPDSKHDDTIGFVALLEHIGGDAHKSSAYTLENLKDPITARSDEPFHAPFNRAFNVKSPFWEWYELPEQSYRRRRFGMAMRGVGAMQPPDLLLRVLDWSSLAKGAIIVDVGGGVGTSSLSIAKAYPHLNVIIQDTPAVTEHGRKVWETEYPEAIESGRAKFQAHDFFSTQPVKNPAVFILNQILHDWSDMYCAKILREIRKAATPSTKLILVDNIVSYACHDPTMDAPDSIPGAAIQDAPSPLLANFGGASGVGCTADMAMLNYLNSQERTIGDLSGLLASTGWRIVRAHRGEPPSNFFEPVEAVPI